MTRRVLAALTALIAAATTALLTASPANALAVTAGFMIQSESGWCTVSFPDPKSPYIVYTAAHCYKGGSTDVTLANYQIGRFIPEIRNRDLDVIAIRLYANVASEYSLMSREPLLEPWVANPGAVVCKYGATTQETCGKVLAIFGDKFTIDMPADHGDSGAPIYERLKPGDKGVHVVGTIISQNKQPGVINATKIQSITNYLSGVWGTSWDMD